MKDYKNYVPVIITACNIAIAIIFTWVESTGSFPDVLQPYQGLLILYYFISWIIVLILIVVMLIIIVNNIKTGAKEIPPFLILFLNIAYLVYIFCLLYIGKWIRFPLRFDSVRFK